MAKIYNKNALLSVFVAESNLSADLKLSWENKINEWSLGEWEDNLLYQLLILSKDFDAELLDYADVLINDLRGNNPDITPYTTTEIKALNVNGDFLSEEKNYKRMLRTIYYGINFGEGFLSFQLRIKLDPIITGQVEIKNLPIEYFTELSIIYLIATCNYFSVQPIEVQRYVFISYLMLLSLDIGINWELLLRDLILTMMNFYERRDLCLDLAASLTQNNSEIGKKPDSQTATILYWIDIVRALTKSKFGGVELLQFINNTDYVGLCTGKEKENIQKFLQLYAHLINGFLILPEVDMDSFINNIKDEENDENQFVYKTDKQSIKNLLKPEEIKTTINSKFAVDDEGNFNDIESVLLELQRIAKQYEDPSVLELLYFDDQDGKFKWSI